MRPLVTIIMATYNRAHFIVETLQSIQSQVFTNWECLIIDDGGSDNTIDVIAPLLEKDTRFQFFKRPDSYIKGLPGSRNYGLDLAQGDYVIFFDDDDIVHPQNLELCVKELSKQNVSFCRYLRNVFFDDFDYNFEFSKDYASFFVTKSDVEKLLINELPFNSCAVMWHRTCFDGNRFVEHLMYAEEWELYSRILSSDIKGISIEKCLFFGRKHADSNTGEFYSNNPIRRASKKDAILLVIESLKEKQLLSSLLLRYFVTMATDFKEYNLFTQIITLLELSIFEKIKWQFFYSTFPLRLSVYKLKKKIPKNIIHENSTLFWHTSGSHKNGTAISRIKKK
ncbi:glycosyltransferase family 2 protein [Flavobacterium sp. RSP46]|uniref:glycosyltransferase family 2 protein n=1 Tax=Flavobacterium sp. RSP46 TaxID=2497486 RepID=UPI000F86C81D|nr:glycosyltransferase family 2 protein [Flavobacterium sp. RSP46]RTY93153.1 glycosyltransferase family 2 protein [Flavobacterium sp. RSP46]